MGKFDKKMRNVDIHLAPSGQEDQPFCLHSTGVVQGHAGDHFEWRDPDAVLMESVLAGQGYLSVGKRSWTVGAGDLYVLSRETARYGSALEEPWSKVFLVASGPLIRTLLPLYLRGVVVCKQAEQSAPLQDIHRLNTAGEPDVHERASIRFLELLIQLARLQTPSRSYSDEVREVLRYIDDNYENRIRVEQLARRVSMSKAHLIRIFHAQVGVTPYEHVIQRRMDAAKVLLRTTRLRMKEIAERLCFADEYYFSTTFKKRVGLPPSAYRRGRH